MKRFFLMRMPEDGTTSSQAIAEGIVFSNGKSVVCWLDKPTGIGVFDSFADLVRLQGRNGETGIQWVDTPVDPLNTASAGTNSKATLAGALVELNKCLDTFTDKDSKTWTPSTLSRKQRQG